RVRKSDASVYCSPPSLHAALPISPARPRHARPGRAAMTRAMTAALRTGDRHLVDRVRRLCVLAGVHLEVVAPGGAPPEATVLLDDRTEPTGHPWRALGSTTEVVDLGGGERALHLPRDAETLLDLLTRVGTPRRAVVVGVVGAVGGVG